MKIKFLGATKTVTGSCFVLENKGYRFAVDCGLHQGSKRVEQRNWQIDLYRPQDLDFILLTHAHIDHSGLLPKMVKHGFTGPIYVTPPTADLLEIMLKDSAHVQAMETEWKNRKNARKGKTKVLEPLYDQEDVERTLRLLRRVDYGRTYQPCPELEFEFFDAGHILGSASIKIYLQNRAEQRQLLFSGDIGRPNQLIVNDPTRFKQADVVVMESTYGDRDHKDENKSADELLEAIWYAYNNGQKVIIPAFAVERTQELLFVLYMLFKEGKLPADLPVFLDSPLAIKATEVFKKHLKYFDQLGQELLAKGENPLDLPNLKYSLSADDSKRLNSFSKPAIIISASGMANAGRIKHHLKHNLWREGASVVFVGFQARGTLGRKIVDGAKEVKIFGERIAVKARIYTINGFSSHAGQSQLLEWLGNFENKKMQVFLVHGEEQKQKILAKLIQQKYGFPLTIPAYLAEYDLDLFRVKEIKTESSWSEWQALVEQIQAYLGEIEKTAQSLPAEQIEEELIPGLEEVVADLVDLKSGLKQF